MNPVLAAVAGLVVLGHAPLWTRWLAILVIVTANSVSVLTAQAP